MSGEGGSNNTLDARGDGHAVMRRWLKRDADEGASGERLPNTENQK